MENPEATLWILLLCEFSLCIWPDFMVAVPKLWSDLTAATLWCGVWKVFLLCTVKLALSPSSERLSARLRCSLSRHSSISFLCRGLFKSLLYSFFFLVWCNFMFYALSLFSRNNKRLRLKVLHIRSFNRENSKFLSITNISYTNIRNSRSFIIIFMEIITKTFSFRKVLF